MEGLAYQGDRDDLSAQPVAAKVDLPSEQVCLRAGDLHDEASHTASGSG
jgi:hypothetical protein